MNASSELTSDLTTPLLAPAILHCFDDLAEGRCSLAKFCREVLEQCSSDESAASGVLLLLEERGNVGRLKQHDFRPLQRALQRQPSSVDGRSEPTLVAISGNDTARPRPARTIGPHTVLCGRYLLQDVIGRGGVGTVYRALDRNRAGLPREQQHIALKVLRSEHARRPEAVRAFRREFHQAQSLSHPGIVNVFDFGHDGAVHFVTMELLDGEPLDALMKRAVPRAQTRDEAIRMLRELGDAVAFAHEHGVVHMDLKPGNVFVTSQGHVRVLDFGLAQNLMGEPWISDAPPDSPAATLAYASCERLAGDLPDVRDDLYSYACLAYELLSGTHPFDRRSALEARREGRKPRRIEGLSRRQWRALKSGLAWSRAERPGGMRELLDDLAPHRAGTRKSTHRSARSSRSSGLARLTLALALTAVAIVLGWNQLPVDLRKAMLDRASSLQQRSTESIEVARSWVGAQWPVTGPEAAPGPAPAPMPQSAPAAVPPIESVISDDEGTSSDTDIASIVTSPEPAPAAEEQAAVPLAIDPPSAETVQPPEPVRVNGSPGLLEFRSEAVTVGESDGIARLTVRRRGGAAGEISFGWYTADDDAIAGEDYAAVSARAVMADGQTTATLLVPIVADSTVEHIELFDVIIDGPTGAQLGSVTSVPVVIVDDD